ncbi:MAG: hypothetical protein Q9190_007190 [Brigantiaea leucoxantha]
MDNYLLPATTYQPPPRQVRKHVLNTIIEDEGDEGEDVNYSEDEKESDGRGRPRYMMAPRSIGSTSPVPSLTSSVSSFYKTSRHSSDYDDLYDVSDDDSIPGPEGNPSIRFEDVSTRSTSPDDSVYSGKSRPRYPSLIIPSPGCWPTIEKAKGISPPLPPKIPLSPAVLSLLPRDLPSASQPPSLYGSSSSDPHAHSTAPVTPESQHAAADDQWDQVQMKSKPGRRTTIFEDFDLAVIEEQIHNGFDLADDSDLYGSTEIRDFACEPDSSLPESPILGTEDGSPKDGVQLPLEALRTLQHLSLEIPYKPNIEVDLSNKEEMREVPPQRSRPSSVDMTPMSQNSEYSLAQLSIPSPGGFFSSLGSGARHTWCLSDSRPPSVPPPSSTTAERFYKCPWNTDPSATIERIVEVSETSSDGPPTARQGPIRMSSEETVTQVEPPDKPPKDYDEDYEKALQEVAEKTLDRTSIWLAAQTSYMSALRETNPVNDLSTEALHSLKRSNGHRRDNSLGSPIKKAVRFLEDETKKRERSSPSTPGQSDSIYYHAFQHIARETQRQDAFRHQRTRADSIQASRICLPHEHIEQLLGKYDIKSTSRPVPLRPISMMPGCGDDKNADTPEQKLIARVERERQALQQVSASMWVMEATKYLYGGNFLNSPIATSFKEASATEKETNRVLDLGGQPNCGWGWQCARTYRNAKVHTATTDLELLDSNLRGPSNHRRTAVNTLWELPYPDDYFSVISARSLFQFLKQEKPLGENIDQYDLCLQECKRCLKPGGYVEFFILDSEIVNTGPLGTAASVEFGFNLRTRGYDPAPTKNWLGRIRRAGFDDIKRAWTFLPMGSVTREEKAWPETPPPDVGTYDEKRGGRVEAVQGPVGSTADAAGMTGLVGSWAWEQWMLKLQIEMGREDLLEGVGAVLEEGKATGAGWRCLTGWARKPLSAVRVV